MNPIHRTIQAIRRRQTTPRCDTCHQPTNTLTTDMTQPITTPPHRQCPTCTASST